MARLHHQGAGEYARRSPCELKPTGVLADSTTFPPPDLRFGALSQLSHSYGDKPPR